MARNPLLETPPYAVELALCKLGANLRTARLRRGLTITEIAQKIGTGPRAVADAERGKPSTGIAVYVALLWSMGLLEELEDVANPTQDKSGMSLAMSRERQRVRHRKAGINNDF